MKTSHGIAIGAAVLTIALAGAAVADPGQCGQGGAGMSAGMGHGQGMGQGHGVEGRLSELKSELNLTTEQQSAWETFERTVRSQQAAHEAGHAQMHAGGNPMENRMEHMEQRIAGMQAVTKARDDLYKVLTPEQKTVADRYFGRRHA